MLGTHFYLPSTVARVFLEREFLTTRHVITRAYLSYGNQRPAEIYIGSSTKRDDSFNKLIARPFSAIS
jgi:hypothetical protein